MAMRGKAAVWKNWRRWTTDSRLDHLGCVAKARGNCPRSEADFTAMGPLPGERDQLIGAEKLWRMSADQSPFCYDSSEFSGSESCSDRRLFQNSRIGQRG